MVDDQVLLPDGGEAVAAMVADAFGIARIIGHEFEIGPLQPVELRQIVEREHAVDQEHFVIRHSQCALHEAAQFRRHGGVELEADHRTAPALLERGLVEAHQVFRFFLDFHFRVADETEGALALDRVAGEQAADEQRGRFLQGDQPDSLVAAAGEPDEALDLLRHADQRVHRLAVAAAGELQRDREGQIGNERERMRRINRQRREQRENVGEETLLEPGALGLLQVGAVDQGHADVCQFGPQFLPALLLVMRQSRHRLADAGELLVGGQSVRAQRGDRLAHLTLQAGDAHHEKFVEVVGRDRQEAHPLQERMVAIGRFLQDAAVEVQPGQFAVDETLGLRPQSRFGRRRDGRKAFVAVRDGSDFFNLCNSLCAICHRNGGLKGRIPNRK